MINPHFWKNKKVYLTGHTGFKGSWLSLWLQNLGAQVKGYALEPATSPSLFKIANVSEGMISEFGDIRDFSAIKRSIESFKPEILIHMAAQPLVRQSYLDPIETYSTNVMGTVHVLEAAKNCSSIKAIVNVTTDKCYENREWPWAYREDEPMGGYDPYSSSKGCAELVTSAFRRSFFNAEISAGLASARAGNVIGGGDWANDRLIPDILTAFQNNQSVIIRNPKSIRPWQFVLEPLSGYLLLAELLYQNSKKYSEAWNFGPREEDAKTVEWILNYLVRKWGENARWELDQKPNPHEATYLKLDTSKARQSLSWTPTWNLNTTLDKIILWQKAYLKGEDMRNYSLNEIQSFMSDFTKKDLN